MFKKLRNKFLFLNMSIITVVMAAAFSLVFLYAKRINTMDMVQRLEDTAQNAARLDYSSPIQYYTITGDIEDELYIQNTYATDIATLNVELVSSPAAPSFITVTDADGQVAEGFSMFDIPDEVYKEAMHAVTITFPENQGEELDYTVMRVDDTDWIYSTSTFVNVNGVNLARKDDRLSFSTETPEEYTVSFFMSTELSNQSFLAMLTAFIAVGVVMLFVIFGISFFFANRAILPITEAWVKQKRFVEDASHELKTPLAIITANMDALEMGEGDNAVFQPWTTYIRHELSRMSKLTGDLLYLARSEDIKNDTALPFSLSQVCNEAVSLTEALIYEKEITFEQYIEDDIYVNADEERIKRAVLVLLDNAVKYTEASGLIHFSLRRQRGNAIIHVINSGSGISPQDLPRIFDRFYRTDSSRSNETGGYGLGLSIAKAAVERAGGIISVRSPGNETVFSIVLKSVNFS